MVWGLSIACFCDSGEGDYRKIAALAWLLLPSAGAFPKQVVALLPKHHLHGVSLVFQPWIQTL